MTRFIRIVKKYYSIIAVIGITIALYLIRYESGYFKSDIETFQNAVKKYNPIIGFLFLIIISVYITIYILTDKFRLKSKSDKKEFVIYNSFFTILLTIAIFISIDGTITNAALLINKLKSYDTNERSYKVGFYDNEKNKLVVLDRDFQHIDMNQKTYNLIKSDTVIQLKFEIGVFKIPFDPILAK